MKSLILPLLATTVLSLPLSGVENQEKAATPSQPKATSEDRPGRATQSPETLARLDSWFTDAKFGVFIHFGVYSALEGEYRGRGANHAYSEWIQHAAEIPAKEYHEIAAGFNPAGFNADEWVETFKNSGARYVVITAKHHDGFALYDSAVSTYNIVDHTPFKRDIVRELEEATHRQGLKFGVYYSQAQDWDEPDAPFVNNKNKTKQLHPGLPADFKPDMDRYITKKSLPQVEELVKNYKIDLIWFDTPTGMNFKRARLFYDVVRKHRPDCIINSRIMYGGKHKDSAEYLALFDYSSLGDKQVPKTRLPIRSNAQDNPSTTKNGREPEPFHPSPYSTPA